jgi:hypothetical protein
MEGKKQWVKPQLIVLGRGTPEENVLLSCKTGIGGTQGPGTGNCAPGGIPCLINAPS